MKPASQPTNNTAPLSKQHQSHSAENGPCYPPQGPEELALKSSPGGTLQFLKKQPRTQPQSDPSAIPISQPDCHKPNLRPELLVGLALVLLTDITDVHLLPSAQRLEQPIQKNSTFAPLATKSANPKTKSANAKIKHMPKWFWHVLISRFGRS